MKKQKFVWIFGHIIGLSCVAMCTVLGFVTMFKIWVDGAFLATESNIYLVWCEFVFSIFGVLYASFLFYKIVWGRGIKSFRKIVGGECES